MLSSSRYDLSKIPLIPNPNGSPPNFVDPPTLAPVLRGVICTMISVSANFVVIRFIASHRQHKRPQMDDYFGLMAWLLATVCGISAMLSLKTDRHAWDVPVSFIDEFWLKNATVNCLLVGPALWFAKAAIALVYMRLFGIHQWLRVACWILIILSAPVYWHTVPLCGVYMFPHGNESWDLSLAKKGTKMGVPSAIVGSLNVALDLCLLLLPQPIIWRMSLSLRKRAGVAGVFMTAGLGLSMSTLSLYYRILLLRSTTDFTDTTWYSTACYLTVSVEMFITIIVSCVPACAFCWNTFVRDTALLARLRYLMRISRLEKPTSTFEPERKPGEVFVIHSDHRNSYDLSLSDGKEKVEGPDH
ncbi:hypothetical protein BDV96DRAFT_552902 [Lophiotrema nucula]|uniref:Rhodopsin domain-containing protein n=1 Tax=Lophiotrema nucula TaxID=690887 RepID=A0A6A5YWT2_9PLEO|nr:hypothetical protein BDV96DRAFT_552902 [Lophiotrema nucula]